MGFVFLVTVMVQVGLGSTVMRRSEPYVQHDVGAVDLTPWRPAPFVGGGLVIAVISIYVYFSGGSL